MTPADPPPRFRLAILLLVAIAARAVTFGNPIVMVDEEFYFAMARAIAQGAIPYVDIWDRKPIGLFLLYLPAGLAGFPNGIWVYQAMALAAAVGTALGIARLADRLGWRRGALPAALLYLLWLDFADGQGGQAPVFYDLLMVWAAALTLDARGPGGRRRGVAAMALVGLALQIKYSVLFEGVWFGLWLLWEDARDRRPRRSTIGYGALLCGTALLPTALAATAYAALGQESAFVFANFTSIFARHADPAAEKLDNVLVAAAILCIPLLLAGLGRHVSRAPRHVDAQRFARGWLGAAVFGFLVFGSWFNHYTLPVLVPAMLCAAAFLGERAWGRRLAVPLMIVALVGGQAILRSEVGRRGTPAQFAAVAAAIGPGPGSLYVYSGSPMLYTATGRRALTRYVFPSHLQIARERGAIGVDQASEIARILDQRPAVVAVQSIDGGERTDLRAWMLARLARAGYRPFATRPLGNKIATLYRL